MPLEHALSSFLEARTPARPLAIFRIGLGLAASARGLVVVSVLYRLQFDPRTVPARPFEWAPQPTSIWDIAVFGLVWLGAAAGLTLGWHARLCAGVLFACGVLAHLADQNLWSNHGYLLLLLTFLACFVESDAALSVRWARDGRPERSIPRWPVLLIGLQMSIVYFYTAIAKINPVFLGGDVIARVAYLPPVLRRPSVFATLAVATVCIELFLVVGLWVRPLRPWAFLLGFALHGSIALLMGPALWIFSLMTLGVYAVFIDAPPRSRLVIWDDRCGFCRSWIGLLRRLDLLAVHRFEGASRPRALAEAGVTPDQAAEEIKLRDGPRVYGGFDAIRLMLELTPAGYLWARALALPPVRWAGTRAYRAVARRRLCGLSRIEEEVRI